MSTSSEAQTYFAGLNKKVEATGIELDGLFEAEGCASYVKTIYVGYDIGGEMVAALYGHADHVELALALDEDHPADGLIDASHLTWRTLPLAAIVKSSADVKKVRGLIEEACARVREGAHGVNRGNDFFIKSRRDRKGR